MHFYILYQAVISDLSVHASPRQDIFRDEIRRIVFTASLEPQPASFSLESVIWEEVGDYFIIYKYLG